MSQLLPYPDLRKGDRTPFDLWRYGGRSGTSSGSPDLPMPFAEWLSFNLGRKPQLMSDVDAYLATRFRFTGETIPGATMSGGSKSIMRGAVAIFNGLLTGEQMEGLSAH